jgi:hypothetical protein
VTGVRLAAVREKMQGMIPPCRRLPIRNASGVLYVIHDSTLTAYAESVGQTTTALDKMIGDLLSVPNFKKPVEAIGLVPRKPPLPMPAS